VWFTNKHQETGMDDYLEKLPEFVDIIRSIKDTIIANIVLIGQTPSPTFKEKNRTMPSSPTLY